jgi:uncharacterized repeat protein (TIGR04076 family)
MGFKVRCRLVAFMADEERFPCHFGYKIGDEFIYDGEKFIGRICPGLFATMGQVIYSMHNVGYKYHQEIPWRYSGLTKKDPNMKKYDGMGFAMRKETPPGAEEKHVLRYSAKLKTEKQGGWHFVCGDSRTSALFVAEIDGLAEVGWFIPYFKREMNILDKIKAEPGISREEIFDRFSPWEREEIYPPLSPLILEFLLEELAQTNYIDIRDGRLFPKSSQLRDPVVVG